MGERSQAWAKLGMGDRKWLSEQPSIHDMYSKTWASVGRDNEWGLDLQHEMKGFLETVSTRSWL